MYTASFTMLQIQPASEFLIDSVVMFKTSHNIY